MPKRPNALPADVDDHLARQRRVVAEGRQRAHAAHLQREPERPEADDPDRVDEEVHPHRVGDVLGAREAGLDQREPRLHEHHQEAGDQRPDDVQRRLAGQHHLARLREILGQLCEVRIHAPPGSEVLRRTVNRSFPERNSSVAAVRQFAHETGKSSPAASGALESPLAAPSARRPTRREGVLTIASAALASRGSRDSRDGAVGGLTRRRAGASDRRWSARRCAAGAPRRARRPDPAARARWRRRGDLHVGRAERRPAPRRARIADAARPGT